MLHKLIDDARANPAPCVLMDKGQQPALITLAYSLMDYRNSLGILGRAASAQDQGRVMIRYAMDTWKRDSENTTNKENHGITNTNTSPPPPRTRNTHDPYAH